MTPLITVAAVALIVYPLVLGVLVAAFGGQRARRWFGGLDRRGRGLVALGLAGLLTGGIWTWPNVVAPRLSDEAGGCGPAPSAAPAAVAPARDAADLTAPGAPPRWTAPGELTGRAAPTAPAGARPALVLYDSGAGDWSDRLSAQQAAHLASHFGPWTVKPVSHYRAGEAHRHSAVLYLSSSAAPSIPGALLDDILRSRVPALWVGENLHRLSGRDPRAWQSRYGFHTPGESVEGVTGVTYRGTTLTRHTDRADPGVRRVRVDDPDKARVLATALGPGAARSPWAVRAANLWYVAEDPFYEIDASDRYLAFGDLLFDALAPGTRARHRALVRLEDISPHADPAQLREIADCLHQAGVPFSFGVIPVYRDPRGAQHDGRPTTITLKDRPEVVDALRHLIDSGGTLVMHGVTHQLGDRRNPYQGVTGEDYEFFTAHEVIRRDGREDVVTDGLVPGHSRQRTRERLDRGLAEFRAAGLPRPRVFEFPHYAAGPDDYTAVESLFGYRYDETMAYASTLTGGPPDPYQRVDQFYPYGVRDLYGTAVIPENLGNVEASGHNGRPPRGPSDLIDAARRNLVVRDGVASFFYHPPLGTGKLQEILRGLRDLGYTFVTPQDVMGRTAR
ncbi:DUF2334 domain-containing protein [Streptomyces flavalbus]|uniref:DUF2334 domain-containing protein n=1 Tax=Streptomyces flavalbus TaxID=2665155 RepID=A0ABW2WK93_9ACTN